MKILKIGIVIIILATSCNAYPKPVTIKYNKFQECSLKELSDLLVINN